MNRRDILRLGSLAAYALTLPAERDAARSGAEHPHVPQWEVFEIALTGPAAGNPFSDVWLSATFTLGSRSIPVAGFYDGDGQYRVRFMPDTEGEWSYVTASSEPQLADKVGVFACIPPLAGVHGPVRVRNGGHFGYADGTPFFPFGTTCYAWVHQSRSLQEQTLSTLRSAPFNKVRMCVFPKSYQYNHNEPPLYPFARSASGASDFTRPNPEFFRHLEERIGNLRDLGIESDLILFHPYDRWGYAKMPREADDLYLRYVIARLSAYRNIWWSMANEYDLMRAKSTQDFDRYFQTIQQCDPAEHLRSIHFSHVMYDYSRPWVTHGCLQSSKFEEAPQWLQAWQKPICFDEVMYEGNLNSRWGNLSGEEMARRFWLGVISGCYVTHGETYLDPADSDPDLNATPTLWWAHGGTLKGSSPERIGFLRKLVESSNAVVAPARAGLEAQPAAYYLNASVLDQSKQPQAILYYMDFHQPIFYDFLLPEGSFTAELVDPWQMTITPVPGTFRGKARIRLAGRPFQALRLRRAA